MTVRWRLTDNDVSEEITPGYFQRTRSRRCALVRGFVVRERDELTCEQASFVPIEVERSTLYRFHADRVGIEEVEELFELSRPAVETIEVPDDHGRGPGLFELPQEFLIGGPCPVLIGGDGFVYELDRARKAELTGVIRTVGSLSFDGGVFAGAVRGDPQIDQGSCSSDGAFPGVRRSSRQPSLARTDRL